MAPISSIAAIAARRAGSARIDRAASGPPTAFGDTKPVVRSTAKARAMSVRAKVKPCCCPLLSPKISAAMPVVTSSARAHRRCRRHRTASRPAAAGTSASMMAMIGG